MQHIEIIYFIISLKNIDHKQKLYYLLLNILYGAEYMVAEKSALNLGLYAVTNV